jgi:hypothetical protein
VSSLPASYAAPTLQLRAPSDRSLLALLTAVCFASAIIGRLCFLHRPFDSDAAIFIYMGRMVSTGGRMCFDLVDNKFPTVGLMTSIFYRAFGTCWPMYVLTQFAMSMAATWLLGRTAMRIAGRRAALPTMLFALVFLNFTTAVFGGFQLETIQVFFTVLAAAAGMEMLLGDSLADAFTAGLCAGSGAMFKPTAAGILLPLAIALVIRKRRVTSNLFAMSIGLVIPVSVALLYLCQTDLLREMPALYRQITTYAHETVIDAIQMIKPVIVLSLLGFPILVRGFVFRRQRTHFVLWPKTSVTLFLLMWLGIETTGVILQRRMYAYHFLPMIPPAALLFGILPRFNRPASLAAALLPIIALSLMQASVVIRAAWTGPDRLAVSDYLSAHAKPGDAVWKDDWPRLVLETGLRPASRLPFTFLFANYDNAGLDYSAMIIADLQRTKPAYVILPTPLDPWLRWQTNIVELNSRPVRRANYITGWRRIEQYTQEHYVKESTVGTDAVYRRLP